MTDYVTLEDFRAWLRTDDTFDDNLLQIAITSASFWIDQRCGRTFGPAAELAETRYFRPTTATLADVDDIAGTDDLVDRDLELRRRRLRRRLARRPTISSNR